MPRPAPAGSVFLLAGCGPNDVILSAFQYGGTAAMSSLHDATDDDRSIDPEAMRAHSRQTYVEQKLGEADCAQFMAQTERTIELVYRIQGLDQTAEAQRQPQLQQATLPASLPASPRARSTMPAPAAWPVRRRTGDHVPPPLFSTCSGQHDIEPARGGCHAPCTR